MIALDGQRVAEHLGQAAVFRVLDERTRDELVQLSRTVDVERGELVWRHGDPASQVAVVLSGRFKLLRLSGGRDVLADVAFPGEVLGEVPALLDEASVYSLVCVRAGALLLVPADAFRRVLDSAPRAAVDLSRDLAVQLKRLERTTEDLSAGSVKRRLARVLLRLADRAGEELDGGLFIPLRLPRADLAALAATTPESTSRQISRWRREGVVEPQPSGYLIRHLAALRGLAEVTH